ncbi:MAG: segregation/condensation protein A, partial [Oscillospiraceae bacterium]|nr:segregation/condensation protein A [Oscillospiraceae bacterium]
MEEPIYRLEGVVQSKAEPEDFVGPLDLILYLLRKNKIAIEDISISVLLDQYLDYLRRRQEMDLTVTSDFVAMGAHLMYIKTRMLLS